MDETTNPINLSKEYFPNLALNSVESLELILKSVPIAIVMVNREGQIVFVNARLEEMFGYKNVELIGHPIEMMLPERFRKNHIVHREDYVKDLRIRPMGSGLNLAGLRKNGQEFPIEVGLSYFELQDEVLVIGSITDITIRKQLADILEERVTERTREIERRRQVSDALRDTLAVLNSHRSLEGTLDYIVTQAIEILDEAQGCAVYRLQQKEQIFTIQNSCGVAEGYVAQAAIPLTDTTIGQAWMKRQPIAISDLGQNLSEQNPGSQERRQALLDYGYQAILTVPILVKNKVYGGLTLYYTTKREFSTEEFDLLLTFGDHAALAIENARLRTQAEQAAVAAERSRLARDLHDSVTQTLFSASVIADVLPRLWDVNQVEARKRSDELRELTRGALAEMRTLLLELRPAKLVEIPLKDLLQQLREAVVGRARLPITLTIEGDYQLPPDVQIAFYRVAQEALNNVAKHARANEAVVTLQCNPESILLSVRDDGEGFDFKEVKPENLGLSIMQERADGIRAQLNIESTPEQGTEVSLIWHTQM